jgi:hypothetical protein
MTEDEAETAGAAIEAALGEAISGVLAQHETSMVLKWIALVETMDGDGDRGLWTFTGDGVKAWDTVGMLQHALHIQQSQTLANAFVVEGDDEDE